MKNTTLYLAAVAMVITAIISCSSPSNKAVDRSVSDTTVNQVVNDTAKNQNVDLKEGFSIAPIVVNYLSLKNALVSGDDKMAANEGGELLATLNKIDISSIPADKHKEYMDIAADAKEHAEHIGDNVGNIGHQREHLVSLSEDLKDLIKLFGAPQTLYQDHCPMFNGGKGAIWFSESKEIKNPYYGSKMIDCGSVQETINSK
ncbi:DUF3347 domain-containing protein [Pedobacter sp.]|uniref:DUF3347 domain-containing protein n=1 Tax=Pedobacter sp. TaxID=1411316 RepID=UPI0031E41533